MIPFLLSVILHGYNLFDSFQDTIFKDKSIRKLAMKIHVKENSCMTKALPSKRPAKVKIKLRDNSLREAEMEEACGGYMYSLPKHRLIEKYNLMLGEKLDKRQLEKIINTTLNLDTIESFFDWIVNITEQTNVGESNAECKN